MERLPWDQRVARTLVAPLADSPVTPNTATGIGCAPHLFVLPSIGTLIDATVSCWKRFRLWGSG